MEKQLKVLILNGSPRADGNTVHGIRQMEAVFAGEGIACETVCVATRDFHSCVACQTCRRTGHCVFNDGIEELNRKLEEADGLVLASPVYYAAANPALTNCLTRMFYSGRFDKTMKVGAAVVCARRSGCTAAFDELNKFLTISGMAVASSAYWNNIHGGAPGESEDDAEGMRTLRTLARNMVFLMRSIALGRERYGLPERETGPSTSFIR